jgi:hypothetical protein
MTERLCQKDEREISPRWGKRIRDGGLDVLLSPKITR